MGITGIDIGNNSISLAAFERGRLTQLVREDLPPELAGAGRVTNHEAMAEFLRALRRRHPGLPKRAALVLQPAEALTRRLQMPAMTEAQLRLNLPFEFRDYIPQDADRYFYDFAVLGQEAAPDAPGQLDLMACAAMKRVIEDHQAMFSRAGMRLVAAMPTPAALQNIANAYTARGAQVVPAAGSGGRQSHEWDTQTPLTGQHLAPAVPRFAQGQPDQAAVPAGTCAQPGRPEAQPRDTRCEDMSREVETQLGESHEWDTQAQAAGVPEAGSLVGGAFATSFCVIDFGTQTTKLRFFARGLYDITRQIEVGGADVDRAIAGAFGVDEATARRYKLEDFEGAQTCSAARAVYEQIAVEVARAVTFYQFSNADVQLELAFCAGAGQALEPLLEAVRAQTSLELAPFEALDGLRGQDPQLHAACFAAIGAALGGESAAGTCAQPGRPEAQPRDTRCEDMSRTWDLQQNLTGQHLAPQVPSASPQGHADQAAVPAGPDATRGASRAARRRARGAAVAVADKRAVNLAQTDARPGSAAAHVALFAALIILVALFAKFLVMAPLSTAAESAQDVAAAQAQLAALEEANANYAEVAQDYARHVVDNLTDAEAALQDRNQVVDLVQQLLLPVGQVTSLAVSDNTITATLTDASMATVSDAVRTLQADARVSYVTVSTAKGTQGSQSDATTTLLEVTLVDGALAAFQGAEG